MNDLYPAGWFDQEELDWIKGHKDAEEIDACSITAAIRPIGKMQTPLYTGQQLAEVEARVKELEGAIRWAHETLYEINPSNYDHADVCKINDASVEVILGLAPLLDERHGKTFEWWVKYSTEEATRRATTAEAEAERLRALVEEANRAEDIVLKDAKLVDLNSNGAMTYLVGPWHLDQLRAARDLRDRLGVEG